MFSVRMRAAAAGEHISGAEQLTDSEAMVEQLLADFARRALRHPKGHPDEIVLTVETIDSPMVVPQLEVVEHHPADPAAADALIASLTGTEAGLAHLRGVTGLRGAMLVDAASGVRREPDQQRGVRVSHFGFVAAQSAGKAYFPEAIALASKLLAHPCVLAELCISDDPDYTTGYVACAGVYHRIHNIKVAGASQGTRVVLLRPGASDDEVADLIDFMEHTPVMVHG